MKKLSDEETKVLIQKHTHLGSSEKEAKAKVNKTIKFMFVSPLTMMFSL